MPSRLEHRLYKFTWKINNVYIYACSSTLYTHLFWMCCMSVLFATWKMECTLINGILYLPCKSQAPVNRWTKGKDSDAFNNFSMLVKKGTQEAKKLNCYQGTSHCTHFLIRHHIPHTLPHTTNVDKQTDLVVSCGGVHLNEFIEAVSLWGEESLLSHTCQTWIWFGECKDVSTASPSSSTTDSNQTFRHSFVH